MAKITTITNPLTGQPVQVDQLEHTAQEIDDGIGFESTDYPGCYYRLVNGVVEWFNPPMLLGVEYRTTERYLGKPVYVEAVDFGAMPNSTNKTLWSSPANNADKIIDFGGEGGGNSFPTGDNAITMTAAITSSKTIAFTITTKSNFSSYNATVWAKYTKTTD